MSHKKTKTVPDKANAAAQEQFVINIEKVFEDMNDEEVVFYLESPFN